ncbi:hypothetical protein V1515DRAFT_609143 [Lipomyces mesembrius]
MRRIPNMVTKISVAILLAVIRLKLDNTSKSSIRFSRKYSAIVLFPARRLIKWYDTSVNRDANYGNYELFSLQNIYPTFIISFNYMTYLRREPMSQTRPERGHLLAIYSKINVKIIEAVWAEFSLESHTRELGLIRLPPFRVLCAHSKPKSVHLKQYHTDIYTRKVAIISKSQLLPSLPTTYSSPSAASIPSSIYSPSCP